MEGSQESAKKKTWRKGVEGVGEGRCVLRYGQPVKTLTQDPSQGYPAQAQACCLWRKGEITENYQYVEREGKAQTAARVFGAGHCS